MKRDMDLVRAILLHAESCSDPYGFNTDVPLDLGGRSNIEVGEHVRLMIDGGLLKTSSEYVRADDGGIVWLCVSMTWAGHEFLDASRNEGIWQQAKDKVMSVGGGVSLALLTNVLNDLLMIKLGLK